MVSDGDHATEEHAQASAHGEPDDDGWPFDPSILVSLGLENPRPADGLRPAGHERLWPYTAVRLG
jgi:hypothetical protein